MRPSRISRLFRGAGPALGRATLLGALSLGACVPQPGTIGAVLGQRADGRLFVRTAPEGLAASRGGLAPGDEILLVDGRDVRNLRERELYGVLSGDVGTTVKLTVVRGDAAIRLTLTRTAAPFAPPRTHAAPPP